MDVDIQECFAALLPKYAVLKEEPGEDTAREAKAPKLEGGKGNGRPRSEASRDAQPCRSRRPKASRTGHHVDIFLQLFGGTTVEGESAKGGVDRPLRSMLIMCLLEHVRKLLGNLQEPRTTTSSNGKGALIADERDPLLKKKMW